MIDVPFNASQVAFVGFEDGVASVPASGPALIYSDVTANCRGIRRRHAGIRC